MADLTHRQIRTNGINLHVAEQGEGPPVVFCHGFPHGWFVWHRQLRAIAGAGFRAVAPDMRGYGRSDAPAAVESYANREACLDLIGLLDDMNEEQAVFVGLDFGAALVWELALRHPDRIRGVIVFNNPFVGRGRRRPSELWAKIAQSHFLHLHYFQEPGPADQELNARPRDFLSSIYYALSGDFHYLDIWANPSHGNGYLDVLPKAPPLPWAWMSNEEFDVLASEFARTGFTGGLNWYRALDLNWELTEEFADARVEVPAFFLYGERDCDMEGFSGADPVGVMKSRVPDLREVVMVPGAGHLVQMEKPAEVNTILGKFLAAL
ncbi:MAG TPA: alpha/beta hydrolase [Acidimicrobiales bacterium]|nr:alpha/beta hydrolase [Acidimicrobiales bacterium]